MREVWFAAALAASLAIVSPLSAKTFRWANDGDIISMDPYARQETTLLSFAANIYEPLVEHDKKLNLEPALSTEWSQTDPTTWRFKLRQGVKFHDGSPFTADDVVFSYERVKTSQLAATVATVKEVRKIDDYTVDIVTNLPDPILTDEITNWLIMSKAWCEKNHAEKMAEPTKNEDNYAVRNANGTGPFMLKEREHEVKTVLVNNPNWWGKPEHNLTEVVFTRIQNDSTRVAALLSGEIDMIYTVPVQDIDRLKNAANMKVLQTPELRTIYLGLDLARDELTDSSIKGKNPLKDLRVRKAIYQAINEEAIKTKIMHGFATPTALMVGPGVNGFEAALNKRFPYDPAAAKKLLVEAGYPEGFTIGFDCPNDRYVNDEQICQAIASMLAQVGIKTNLVAQTKTKFFTKINAPAYDTPFFLLGWTPATYDVHNALISLLHTRGPSGAGLINDGGYSNPTLDALIDKIQVETDKAKRDALIHDAEVIVKDDIPTIPLHQQAVVWAMRSNINVVQLADNFFPLRYVTVK
ncbi:MAG: ABC transporter substrate-binding protein [Alphaproteobacteria bacterium]|nr:ABC transporter substrate-binding protein [Alphaproteobacteria bacterium]